MSSEDWEWFCGVNSTIEKDDILNSTCIVNGILAVPQLGFILLSSLALLILGCCTSYGQRTNSKYLFRLPGHSQRWLLTYVFVVLSLSFVAEGILTNDTYHVNFLPNQPHLYVAAIMMVVSAMLSLIYYHMMERWRARHMLWLLLIYWIVSLLTLVVEMLHLGRRGVANWNVFRFDVTLALILLFVLMLVIDLTLCFSLMFGGCGDPLNAEQPEDTKLEDMNYFHDFACLLSSVTYWWMNWLFAAGYKKPVEPSDLGSIPHVDTSEYTHETFKKNFLIEKKRAEKMGTEISLYRVYWKTYWPRILTGGFFKLCADMTSFVGPVCISGIVLYVTNSLYESSENQEVLSPHHVTVTEFFANGYVLIGCTYVAALVRHTFDQCYYYWCAREGIHVKSALQSMVYEKSLRLSTYAMSGGMMTMGQVTNHMSVDATNVQFFFNFGNELWTVPIRITLTLVLLYLQLGPPALIGASLFFVVIPIQLKLATATSKYMKDVLINADQRLKSSNEMLQGMKILKLYGWERVYCETIKAVRSEELKKLYNVYFLAAINFVINSGTPIAVNLISFTTYTAITGDLLTPDVAFSSLSLFNALTDPMFVFPYVISLFVNAHVSTNRLKFFLMAPEVEGKEVDKSQMTGVNDITKVSVAIKRGGFKKNKTPVTTDDELEMDKSPLLMSHEKGDNYGSMDQKSDRSPLPDDVAIRIKGGCFTWDADSTIPILKDIDLDIPAGQLTVMIGTVGSGKSSLLQAMMGEMTTLTGSTQIKKDATVAYGPQKAWLVNASLKDNITFGEQFENIKYRKIVDACALGPDISMLPGGDYTEIGEKGINLSGGQKQRVSVARTMYSGRDIIILDDPLSALDMHVGSHLFENGILKILKKQKQTVILVTHQLQYLPEADKIIVMRDGRIALQGDPDEIAQADPSICSDWQRAIQLVTESEGDLSEGESEALLEERRSLKKQISQLQLSTTYSTGGETSENEEGRLIVQEDQEKGSVSYKIYMYYIKSMNYVIAALMIITVLIRAAIQIGTNFWLAIWSEASVISNNTETIVEETDYYISIYAVFSVASIVMRVFSIICITIGVFLAAKHMHIAMLSNIIAIPMRFFDTTPTGRILNRFSSDTQLIDQRLLQTVRMLINLSSQLLSSIVVIIAVNLYFIIFMIPITIAFLVLMVYYIVTSRELQRCESVTRSPIFAHFSETLGGLPTIRAFQDEKRFFQTALDRILVNNRVYLYLITAQRWVAIRLDYLGAFIVLLASLSSLIGAFYLNVDASYVGLAISYSLEISLYMNLVMRAASDMELQMNAVERVQSYTNVPTEDYSGTEPPDLWPENGKIELDNISVRYARELDPVLNGITLTISSKEKLGICGRTGSGKSSLTLALFRIIDTFQGHILIDGIDIARVPLLTLRQRLSIIPQDAFLFTGTIRSNLDPTNSKQDDELWKALEIAQLKDVVQQLNDGLDYQVTEGGDNFSVGQRQLFCLARAFLRNSKIVIMDEATASIDQETDRILQDVVADIFEDRTVLTIAHRVGTIMDADTILTLSDGKVIEFDSPATLLEQETSIFASLVKAGK